MKSLTRILGYTQSHPDTPIALATLVRTQGSTYRKPGARMLITPQGQTLGVLSGGCLEEIITQDGLHTLQDGQPRLRHIDTQQYFGCEGHLEIFVERLPPAHEKGNVLTHLATHMDQRRDTCLCTQFSGHHQGTTLTTAFSLLKNKEEVFIQRIPLPIRLWVFGQGPEIEPLTAQAQALGWVLQVFEHPSECGDPCEGDSLTAALIMNHHFGKDAQALQRTLSMSLPYIGILGPRRRTNQLFTHLLEADSSLAPTLDSIHAPAGLDIGSESPEEIVLSIVSEILAVLSGHQAGFLSNRQESPPDHARATLKEA